MIKIIYLGLLIVLFLVFSCIGCAAVNKEAESDDIQNEISSAFHTEENTSSIPSEDEENTHYVPSTLSREKSYDTLESLNEVAANVFAGTCISSKPIFQLETLYTLSEVRVTRVFKGGFKIGDIVLIEEMGGRTTFGEYQKGCNIEQKAFETDLESVPDDKEVVTGVDGFFPLKEKEEVLLFVGDSSGFLKEVKEPTYSIWGVYDGKLYLQEDGSYARPFPSLTDIRIFGEGTLVITIDELNNIN